MASAGIKTAVSFFFFGFWAVVCFKEGGTGWDKADYASVQCSFSSVVRAMVL